MTDKELLNLVNNGESQTVSLKSLKAKPSVLGRPMVSFSNTNNGIIIVGVDDKTRKVCGAKTTKQKEEGLDNIHKAAKQCCQPNVDISKIEEVDTSGGTAFVVSVIKDTDEVYVTEGAVLVRKGTMDIKPSNYDIQLLFSKRNKLKFEEEIVDGTTMEDIDFKKISKFRKEYFKNRKKRLSGQDMDILKQFGCIKSSGKKDNPTVTGILCFGKIPQQFFSLDYIHIFRYGASEDVLWFSDRIEILNPGLLLDPITPENIYIIRNKQRNPNIARILTGYGYAEQIGEGMQLFKRECDKHPFKPKYPEYREWVDATITVLHPAEVGVSDKKVIIPEELNERQKKAIEYIQEKGFISRREYAALTNISLRQANRDLEDLLKRKAIIKIGKGRNIGYKWHD